MSCMVCACLCISLPYSLVNVTYIPLYTHQHVHRCRCVCTYHPYCFDRWACRQSKLEYTLKKPNTVPILPVGLEYTDAYSRHMMCQFLKQRPHSCDACVLADRHEINTALVLSVYMYVTVCAHTHIYIHTHAHGNMQGLHDCVYSIFNMMEKYECMYVCMYV